MGLVHYPSGTGPAGRIDDTEWNDLVDFLGGETTDAQVTLPKMADVTGTSTATSRQYISWNSGASLWEPFSTGAAESMPTDADTLDGQHAVSFAVTGSDPSFRAVTSTATGVAPFTVTGVTVVTNLNADLLDGYEAARFYTTGTTVANATDSDTLDTVHASQFITTGYSGDFVHTGSSPTFVTITATGTVWVGGLFFTEPNADHTACGLMVSGVVGTGVALGQTVFASATRYYVAVGASSAQMPVVGLATEAIASAARGAILLDGYMRDDSWTWTMSTPMIYASSIAGVMTQTLPSVSTQQVQMLGYARNSGVIRFSPQLTLVEIV